MLLILIAIPLLVINWLYLIVKLARAQRRHEIVYVSTPHGPQLNWTILLVGWPVIIAVLAGVLLSMLDTSGSYLPGIIVCGSIFTGLCALGIRALVIRLRR